MDKIVNLQFIKEGNYISFLSQYYNIMVWGADAMFLGAMQSLKWKKKERKRMWKHHNLLNSEIFCGITLNHPRLFEN